MIATLTKGTHNGERTLLWGISLLYCELKYFAVRILYLNLYKHHQFAADIPPNSRMTYPEALQGMGRLGPLGPDRPRVWIKHKKVVCKIVCTRFGMEIFSPF